MQPGVGDGAGVVAHGGGVGQAGVGGGRGQDGARFGELGQGLIGGGVDDGVRTTGFCMPPNTTAFRYVCAHTPSGCQSIT